MKTSKEIIDRGVKNFKKSIETMELIEKLIIEMEKTMFNLQKTRKKKGKN